MGRIATSHTPLAASGVYTDSIRATVGDKIVGAVFSDQSGTLFIEQSLDGGVTWAISTSVAVTGGTAVKFSESVHVTLCQIRYVNGGTNQTKFDLVARPVTLLYNA